MSNKAPQALRDWLAEQERSASWLGRQVSVAPSTVKRWLADGGTVPTRETRRRLSEITGLSIAAEDAWHIDQ
jgi:hypothetical protein